MPHLQVLDVGQMNTDNFAKTFGESLPYVKETLRELRLCLNMKTSMTKWQII